MPSSPTSLAQPANMSVELSVKVMFDQFSLTRMRVRFGFSWNMYRVSVSSGVFHLLRSSTPSTQLENMPAVFLTFAVFQPVRSSVASFVQYSNMWPISLTLPVSQPSMLRSVSRWSWLNRFSMLVTFDVFQPSMLRLVRLVQYSNM